MILKTVLSDNLLANPLSLHLFDVLIQNYRRGTNILALGQRVGSTFTTLTRKGIPKVRIPVILDGTKDLDQRSEFCDVEKLSHYRYVQLGAVRYLFRCLDTTNNIWYRAKALTNTDWIAIGEHGLTQAELTVLNVVAGVGTVSRAMVLDSSGDVEMPASGILGMSGEALAAAGSSSSDAAVISEQVTAVTASDGTKGVALPAADAGDGAGHSEDS